MTRFVITPDVALRLAQERAPMTTDDQLLAPALIRSQLLSNLYQQVRQGSIDKKRAEQYLDYFRGLQLRLLGDRVLQSVAWRVADELQWDDTYRAEYVALTQLQADALVTLDRDLAKDAKRLVRVAPVKELLS